MSSPIPRSPSNLKFLLSFHTVNWRGSLVTLNRASNAWSWREQYGLHALHYVLKSFAFLRWCSSPSPGQGWHLTCLENTSTSLTPSLKSLPHTSQHRMPVSFPRFNRKPQMMALVMQTSTSTRLPTIRRLPRLVLWVHGSLRLVPQNVWEPKCLCNTGLLPRQVSPSPEATPGCPSTSYLASLHSNKRLDWSEALRMCQLNTTNSNKHLFIHHSDSSLVHSSKSPLQNPSPHSQP